MLDMCLPGGVLQYLLYLSSRAWSCKNPWLLTPVLPKGLESPGEFCLRFALQRVHTLLLLDKRQCEPAQWEPPSVIRAHVDLEIRTIHCFVFL